MDVFTDDKVKDLVKFQINRQIKNLFKTFLLNLEDLQDDFNIPDYIYAQQRKRILDAGNNTIRELEELLNSLKIEFKGDVNNENK